MKHPGDPTPQSIDATAASRSYRVVVRQSKTQPNGAQFCEVVVFHCGTETYWQTFCSMVLMNQPSTWHEVLPVVETRTTYRLKDV